MLPWGCSSPPAPPPSEDVLRHRPAARVTEAMLLGKELFAVRDGDVVFPAFSPDGRWLAWANVVVRGKTEFTGVWVRDLKTRKNMRLLTADQSGKYATYAAFVYNLRWEGNQTLVANISDGDVDTTRVRWKLPGGKKLDSSFPNTELEFYNELKRKIGEFSRKPELPESALETAIQNSFRLGKGHFVGQIQHAGYADHILMLHPDGRIDQLMKLPDSPGYGLVGGFKLGPEIVFLLSGQSHNSAYLFSHSNGKNRKLIGFRAPAQNSMLRVLGRSRRGVWMLAQLGFSYEPPAEMGLFFYRKGPTGGELLRPRNFREKLHSAAFSPGAGLIALSIWQGKTRRLSVRRLEPVGN